MSPEVTQPTSKAGIIERSLGGLAVTSGSLVLATPFVKNLTDWLPRDIPSGEHWLATGMASAAVAATWFMVRSARLSGQYDNPDAPVDSSDTLGS